MRGRYLPTLAIMKVKNHFLFIFFPFLFACCKDKTDNGNKNETDLNAFLTHYSENIIRPSYTNFQDKLNAFETGINNYNQGDLETIRPLFDSVYNSWQNCGIYDFGPATTYNLSQNVNIYPVDTVNIKLNIETPPSDISPSTFATVKGLASLDYLLYKKDTLSAKDKVYIKLLIDDIQYKVGNTVKEWNDYYAAHFISNKGFDAGSSICFLSNAYVKYFERDFRHGKLGIPLGVLSSGSVLVDKVEAKQSKHSSILFKESFKHLKNFYYGNNTLGFDNLLQSESSTLDAATYQKMETLWSSITTKTNALNIPIEELLTSNKPEAQLMYNDIQALLTYLKVDMISSLSLKIKYIDQDGD